MITPETIRPGERALPLIGYHAQLDGTLGPHGDPLAALWNALREFGHPDPRGRAVTRANHHLADVGMVLLVRRGALNQKRNRLRRYGLALRLPDGYGGEWAELDVSNPWPFFAHVTPYTNAVVIADMKQALGLGRSNRTGFGYRSPDDLLEFMEPIRGSSCESAVTALLRHRSVESRLRRAEDRLGALELELAAIATAAKEAA